MSTLKLFVLPGDGIGPEVMAEVERIANMRTQRPARLIVERTINRHENRRLHMLRQDRDPRHIVGAVALRCSWSVGLGRRHPHTRPEEVPPTRVMLVAHRSAPSMPRLVLDGATRHCPSPNRRRPRSGRHVGRPDVP